MRFAGREARPRQLAKHIRVLLWVLRHSYIDRITTMHLLHLNESAALQTLKDLRDRGLLALHHEHNVGCPIHRLTPAGAAAVDPYRGMYDQDLKAVTNPSDFPVHLAPHNLLAQRVAAKWLRQRDYDAHVLSPRQIVNLGLQIGVSSENKSAWKIPDMLLITPIPESEQEAYDLEDRRMALEVQQSTEAPAARAHKLWQYWRALEKAQIQSFAYLSTHPRILKSYEDQWNQELEERKYVAEWHKWITPTNPRRIAPGTDLLLKAQFVLLPHDPFAVGLYRPHRGDDSIAVDGTDDLAENGAD